MSVSSRSAAFLVQFLNIVQQSGGEMKITLDLWIHLVWLSKSGQRSCVFGDWTCRHSSYTSLFPWGCAECVDSIIRAMLKCYTPTANTKVHFITFAPRNPPSFHTLTLYNKILTVHAYTSVPSIHETHTHTLRYLDWNLRACCWNHCHFSQAAGTFCWGSKNIINRRPHCLLSALAQSRYVIFFPTATCQSTLICVWLPSPSLHKDKKMLG